jgi:short-subunit dehydrogenase
VLLARSVEALSDAAAELRRGHPRSLVVAEALDVGDRDAIPRLDAVLARHGLYLDVLVNNAGIALGGDFSRQDPQAIEHATYCPPCARDVEAGL